MQPSTLGPVHYTEGTVPVRTWQCCLQRRLQRQPHTVSSKVIMSAAQDATSHTLYALEHRLQRLHFLIHGATKDDQVTTDSSTVSSRLQHLERSLHTLLGASEPATELLQIREPPSPAKDTKTDHQRQKISIRTSGTKHGPLPHPPTCPIAPLSRSSCRTPLLTTRPLPV